MQRYTLKTPVGSVSLLWNEAKKLTSIQWFSGSTSTNAHESAHQEIPKNISPLTESIRTYFSTGEPIPQIPWDALHQQNWSEFQKQVYHALTLIPHGETRTYAWVAWKSGKTSATRAVGQALRNNPFPILIPCHRVVSKNTLGGFMGTQDPNQPELKLKQWLIETEERYRNPIFPFLSCPIHPHFSPFDSLERATA